MSFAVVYAQRRASEAGAQRPHVRPDTNNLSRPLHTHLQHSWLTNRWKKHVCKPHRQAVPAFQVLSTSPLRLCSTLQAATRSERTSFYRRQLKYGHNARAKALPPRGLPLLANCPYPRRPSCCMNIHDTLSNPTNRSAAKFISFIYYALVAQILPQSFIHKYSSILRPKFARHIWKSLDLARGIQKVWRNSYNV